MDAIMLISKVRMSILTARPLSISSPKKDKLMVKTILRIIIFIWTLIFIVPFGTKASAADIGAVTAIAVGNTQRITWSWVGYSSGAVAYCSSVACSVLSGTPKSKVTAIDSTRGLTPISAWVGYENGDVYLCSSSVCTRLGGP